MLLSIVQSELRSVRPGRGVLLGCLVVLCTACSSTINPDQVLEPANEAPATAALAGGFDPSEFSESIRPQDDFFDHINAQWIATNEIPEDRTRYGIFNVVFDRTELQVRALIEAAAAKTTAGEASSEEARIGSVYLSFMDEDQVNRLGLAPLEDLLSQVEGVSRHQQLAEVFGVLQTLDINLPVGFYVDGDAADPQSSLAYFWQGGLGLPDRDYYSNHAEKFVDIRAKYLEHIERMHKLAGWDKAAQRAKDIFELEDALSRLHWSRVQNRDRQRIYTNKISVASHPQAEFWQPLLASGGFGSPQTIVLAQDDYFAQLPAFINQTPLSIWKAYIKFRILESFASYLSTDIAAESFEFRGKTLRGQQVQRPRWKRGVAAVNGLLGESVGQVYVAQHFPPSAKTKIADMVEGLRTAFGEAIDELSWMAEETREEARTKLAAFNKKVGYPDAWRDYSTLKISPDTLIANVRAGRVFENTRHIAKLTNGVDRTEWGMTPQTINAYYRPTLNEIVFPAAILQAPFFDSAVDDAFNYGAIGSVIGHEFSHGFDNQGRKFDGSGALRDWWTEADAAAYAERAAALVEQYEAFEPLPDARINGKLTLAENIGDLAGLTMAYRAYKNAELKTWGKAGAPVIDGYTSDQRFFIGFAHAWRGSYRDEALGELLLRDPHSPGKFRVIGVLRNLDAFYTAFDVQPGDKMYLPPSERVRIW